MLKSILFPCLLLCVLLLAGCGDDRVIEDPSGLLEVSPHLRRNTAFWLGRSGRADAVELLSKQMDTDTDPVVRGACAKALGETRRSEAVTPLRNALKDENSFVRNSAAEALSDMRAMEAEGDLKRLLESDTDAGVRKTSAFALGRLASRSSIEALIKGVQDNDARVRHAAARALTKITGEPFDRDFDAWVAWWDGVNK